MAGNVESLPPGLNVDAGAQTVSVTRIDGFGRETQSARAVEQRLADGRTLVIGRKLDEVNEIFEIVWTVAALGLFAALCVGLAAAAWLSMRSQRRIEEVNRRIQLIVAGELKQRLPTTGNE